MILQKNACNSLPREDASMLFVICRRAGLFARCTGLLARCAGLIVRRSRYAKIAPLETQNLEQHNPMRDPDQQFSRSVMLACSILIGLAAGQIALADSEELVTALTGQQVYNNVCIACHSPPGVGGAPALGDSDAWAERIANGMDMLTDHALNGFSGKTGVMPKKGERVDLSDEEVIAAVKYMVEQVVQ